MFAALKEKLYKKYIEDISRQQDIIHYCQVAPSEIEYAVLCNTL